MSMLDHIGILVRDIDKSVEFYTKALAPLGVECMVNTEYEGKRFAGFGDSGKPYFWFGQTDAAPGAVHVCFLAKNIEEVKAFYEASLKAGGNDNGGPGLRPHYHPNYYGAFVLDPDGHNIEAVYHGGT